MKNSRKKYFFLIIMNILCLHGFRTNMNFMRNVQMQSLFNGLKQHQQHPDLKINWHFLNGSIATDQIATPDIQKMIEPPYYEWYDGDTHYGLGTSINTITHYIENHNIHGILGFSQGACMASIILHHCPTLRFGIFVCGINSLHPDYSSMINIPSFHIIGNKDPIRHRSLSLFNQFKNGLLQEVPYDHRFPMFQRDYNKLIEFLIQHS